MPCPGVFKKEQSAMKGTGQNVIRDPYGGSGSSCGVINITELTLPIEVISAHEVMLRTAVTLFLSKQLELEARRY